MRIGELGESAFIRQLRTRFPSPAVLGIGDDAAIINVPPGHSIVYCSDLVAEDAHFSRGLHPARSVGYKAVAVNVSDVGAMGGVPLYCTMSIALPASLEVDWLNGFIDGFAQACEEFGVALVGGDSSSGNSIFVDVSMIGGIPAGGEIRRSGARPGDRIYVTGELGGSALGLELLQAGGLSHPAIARHLYPSPRHKVGQAVADCAHAMIDISDGLSTDLQHVLDESHVSARIDKTRLPAFSGANDSQILHGGEEYELLITAENLPDVVEGIRLAEIGEIVSGSSTPQILLIDGSTEIPLIPRGYEHFSS